MNLKNILLLVAACTIVLGITYLTLIIWSEYDIKQKEAHLSKILSFRDID